MQLEHYQACQVSKVEGLDTSKLTHEEHSVVFGIKKLESSSKSSSMT